MQGNFKRYIRWAMISFIVIGVFFSFVYIKDSTESYEYEPFTVGENVYIARFAQSLKERTMGLSGTVSTSKKNGSLSKKNPSLGSEDVMVFIFPYETSASIWMKDMNFDIDVVWIDSKGVVRYLVEGMATSSYPNTFSSPSDVLYVVEARVGFINKNSLKIGDKIVIPSITKKAT